MKLLQLFRKEKINEFSDIQEQMWYSIRFVGREWSKEDIVVIRDPQTICVGQFSSYDVFIPVDYISIRDLLKIKHYHVMSISKYPNGLKIHLLSNRIRKSTTNNDLERNEN